MSIGVPLGTFPSANHLGSNDDKACRDRRAPLIPDARNDENLAVAQTHLAFIRFHNRVVEELALTGLTGHRLFAHGRYGQPPTMPIEFAVGAYRLGHSCRPARSAGAAPRSPTSSATWRSATSRGRHRRGRHPALVLRVARGGRGGVSLSLRRQVRVGGAC